VNQILGALTDEGVIRVRRGSVDVIAPDRLRAQA
jgi:hypothetical protein